MPESRTKIRTESHLAAESATQTRPKPPEDPRHPDREPEGRVYFIAPYDGGPVKVGWSIEPLKRLKDLQVSHWMELELLGCIPGKRKLEEEIQSELNYAHIRGEWFEREAAEAWLEEWQESPNVWGALGWPVFASAEERELFLSAGPHPPRWPI